MDGLAAFIPDAQNGASPFKIALFQFADDAATIVFCGPIAWQPLSLRIVVGVIRHFDDEIIWMHGPEPATKAPNTIGRDRAKRH